MIRRVSGFRRFTPIRRQGITTAIFAVTRSLSFSPLRCLLRETFCLNWRSANRFRAAAAINGPRTA